MNYSNVFKEVLKKTKFKCIDTSQIPMLIEKLSPNLTESERNIIKVNLVNDTDNFDYFKEGNYYSQVSGGCHFVKNSYLCLKGIWIDSLEMKEKRRWESFITSDLEQKEYLHGGLAKHW